MSTHFDLLGAFKQLGPHETPTIGGTTKALRMLDTESQQLVAELGDQLAEQRELGRHGSVARVFDEYQVPVGMRPTVEKIMDAAEADDVAVSLQRRMGTDADLPPPPITSRDHVAAAFELHSQGAENA